MFNCGKTKILLFYFIISMAFVKCQMDYDDMEFQNELNVDITHDLSDDDLRLILNDLSLNDLSSLQQFIDSADYNYLEYQKNGEKLDSTKTKDYNHKEFQKFMDYPEQHDYSFGPQGSENDLIHPFISQKNFMQFLQQSQRLKKRNINDEYIKQLDYSFPQNGQRNNDNDIERKKFHIRVKRN